MLHEHPSVSESGNGCFPDAFPSSFKFGPVGLVGGSLSLCYIAQIEHSFRWIQENVREHVNGARIQSSKIPTYGVHLK